MKKLFTLAVLIASFACFSSGVGAAEGSKDKPSQSPGSENRPKQMPFRGKVSAVDKTVKTVTLEGKDKGRTYQITSATKITKDGKPAVLNDVVVGESVAGLAKQNAAGKWEVATLRVGAATGTPKKGDKK